MESAAGRGQGNGLSRLPSVIPSERAERVSGGIYGKFWARLHNRDRGAPRGAPPPTPPCVRVTYTAVRTVKRVIDAELSVRLFVIVASVPSSPALGVSPLLPGSKASSIWLFCRSSDHEARLLLAPCPFGPSRLPPVLCPLLTSAPRSGGLSTSSVASATRRRPPGVRPTAFRTHRRIYAPRSWWIWTSWWIGHSSGAHASYPVRVPRCIRLLHASFRPHLAMTPLRFAIPSPPPGWEEDSHLQAAGHARHTIPPLGPFGSSVGMTR